MGYYGESPSGSDELRLFGWLPIKLGILKHCLASAPPSLGAATVLVWRLTRVPRKMKVVKMEVVREYLLASSKIRGLNCFFHLIIADQHAS